MQNKAGEKNCSSVQQFFYCVIVGFMCMCVKKNVLLVPGLAEEGQEVGRVLC